LSKIVAANNWIPQAVQQGIPDRWTSHTESHRSWAGDALRPRAVGWCIGDVAVMGHLQRVGTVRDIQHQSYL